MNAYDITSTSVKADWERVAEVLGKYELFGVDVQEDDQGQLQVVAVEDENGIDEGPFALKTDQTPRREDYSNEEDYEDDIQDSVGCDGKDGFEALLGELSFCIETPLTVLAVHVDDDGHWASASAWRLVPKSGVVERLGTSAMY